MKGHGGGCNELLIHSTGEQMTDARRIVLGANAPGHDINERLLRIERELAALVREVRALTRPRIPSAE